MKTILISLFFLLNIQNDKIKILKINSHYKYYENINYSIVSVSDKKIIYFVGLENYRNEWREMYSDITNPHSKSTKLLSLKPMQSIKKKIELNKLNLLKGLDKNNLYRLVIAYKIENDTTKRYFRSKSFVIE